MNFKLITGLVTLGYEISLEGDRVVLDFMRQGNPPEDAQSLIAELRDHKAEVVDILRNSKDLMARNVVAKLNDEYTEEVNGYIRKNRPGLHQVERKAMDRVNEFWRAHDEGGATIEEFKDVLTKRERACWAKIECTSQHLRLTTGLLTEVNV